MCVMRCSNAKMICHCQKPFPLKQLARSRESNAIFSRAYCQWWPSYAVWSRRAMHIRMGQRSCSLYMLAVIRRKTTCELDTICASCWRLSLVRTDCSPRHCKLKNFLRNSRGTAKKCFLQTHFSTIYLRFIYQIIHSYNLGVPHGGN